MQQTVRSSHPHWWQQRILAALPRYTVSDRPPSAHGVCQLYESRPPPPWCSRAAHWILGIGYPLGALYGAAVEPPIGHRVLVLGTEALYPLSAGVGVTSTQALGAELVFPVLVLYRPPPCPFFLGGGAFFLGLGLGGGEWRREWAEGEQGERRTRTRTRSPCPFVAHPTSSLCRWHMR
jgi:hypothetical protein